MRPHDTGLGEPLRVADRIEEHQRFLHLVLLTSAHVSVPGIISVLGRPGTHRILVLDQTLVIPAQGYQEQNSSDVLET